MSDNREKIRVHVGEMLAANEHIHDALRRQVEDDDLRRDSEAHRIVSRAEMILARQHQELESLIETFDERLLDKVKEGISSLLGSIAGLYDKVRGDTASRMLRDDYTALSLATAAYTMLHAAGLAYGHPRTADLALRHLKELTPLVVDLSEALPEVVVRELSHQHEGVDATVGPTARRNTQQAWQPQHVDQDPAPAAAMTAGTAH